MRCPSRRRWVAWWTPTTAGMPYSRATTEPCVIIPPTSIISPPATIKSGVQAGSVPGQTMISPGANCAPCGWRITRTFPSTTPGETGLPLIAAGLSSPAPIPS